MVTEMYTFVRIYGTAYLRSVHFAMYKSYFNNELSTSKNYLLFYFTKL